MKSCAQISPISGINSKKRIKKKKLFLVRNTTRRIKRQGKIEALERRRRGKNKRKRKF
jgi:hypothetical protein